MSLRGNAVDKRVFRLPSTSSGQSKGCVLISYLVWPFYDGIHSDRMRGHTNASESLIMADAYSSLGFRVEVIDRRNIWHRPPDDVAVAIDIQRNLERWDLPAGAIRVLHATGAHWLFANQAERHRLEELKIRRGIELNPRRQVEATRAPEVGDRISVLGNDFTMGTYGHLNKTIDRIPISSAYEFPFDDAKDWNSAKRRFLWMGSYGMVHKGLDLVLEAFARMPDLELTICGRPQKEEDFFKEYRKEIQSSVNIKLAGWIDPSSPEFLKIASTHASVVYPSCSEGGGGSVIHCMHAGLIPICTKEASVDLVDFGDLIRAGSVSAVQEAVRKIASMGSDEIELRSRATWFHVRVNHSRVRFRENYRRFAASIVKN
jgi:glycosyltransferase involved in cell wall biosynthesis